MMCFGLIMHSLMFLWMIHITRADANIMYYVSGYVGKSISCWRKCSSCKELLIASDDSFSIHHYLPDEYKQLFENVNCGGLSQPSQFIYTLRALAVQHYMAGLANLFYRAGQKMIVF